MSPGRVVCLPLYVKNCADKDQFDWLRKIITQVDMALFQKKTVDDEGIHPGTFTGDESLRGLLCVPPIVVVLLDNVCRKGYIL